jgi:GT2 family glycosyltransferase
MVSLLAGFIEENENCGMVGPLMLFKQDPSIIWLYFAGMNMHTSKSIYKGSGEKDKKQYGEIIETGHLPNCFLVRKKDFEEINGFDEKYFIMFEEADLAEKIKKKLGKKIFVYSKAITCHDLPLPDNDSGFNNYSSPFVFRSEQRAYLTARNRIYFMKKNASFMQLASFALLFYPLILIYYEFNLLKAKKFRQALYYLKGSFRGVVY